MRIEGWVQANVHQENSLHMILTPLLSFALLLGWLVLTTCLLAAAEQQHVFRDCDDKDAAGASICPEMVEVPPGEFMMGTPAERLQNRWEGPQRKVTIEKSFAIGRFEVTRDEFETFAIKTGHTIGDVCMTLNGNKRVMRSGLSFRIPSFPQVGSHPVVCVSWNDAKSYTDWLSEKTGKAYRLPTEAEWEYATRAGATSWYHFGETANDLCNYANVPDATARLSGPRYDGEFVGCSDGHIYTAPVGSFRPNAFGLYDVHGNVSEWVEDCYTTILVNAPSNGSAFSLLGCSKRASRGGSWFNRASGSSYRSGTESSMRSFVMGFRVARSLP